MATPPCRKTHAGAALMDTKLEGEANMLICPNLDAANILFNVLKITGGHGVTVGPILLGVLRPRMCSTLRRRCGASST
jgi:phosphotransacetylase